MKNKFNLTNLIIITNINNLLAIYIANLINTLKSTHEGDADRRRLLTQLSQIITHNIEPYIIKNNIDEINETQRNKNNKKSIKIK